MRRIRTAVAVFLCLLLCCTACGSGNAGANGTTSGPTSSTGEMASEPVEREIFAMDTYMTLRVWGAEAQAALDAAEQEIQRLDALLSVSAADSEISRVNNGETVTLSEDTAVLMEEALKLSEETNGAFDVTIFPLMEAWGFSSGNYNVLSESERKELLVGVGREHVHYDRENGTLSLDEGTRIDLGGIAKGYLADRLKAVLRERQVPAAMLSLGSSTIQLVGEKPDGSFWNVALRDPQDTEAFAGILSLEERVINTSGGYERFFEQNGKTYWHILDPATGAPAESGLRSVTVVGDNGVTGDGLTTAMFVMGEEQALDYWRSRAGQFELVLVREDGTIVVTQGLASAFASEHETVVVQKED